MIDFLDDLKDQFWKDGRIEELRQVANKMQYKFSKREQFESQKYEIKDFKLFKGKQPKRLKPILWNKDLNNGLNIRIYDYHYYSDGGKKMTTVFEIENKQYTFPSFIAGPKKSGYKFKEFFMGDQSQVFFQHEQFHKTHMLETKAPDEVERILNTLFLDQLQASELTLEAERNFMIFYKKNIQLPAKDIEAFLDKVMTVIDALRADDQDPYEDEYV